MTQKLFEQRCMENVPDSVFKKLMQNYDVEQANLNQIIAEKRNVLMEMENAAIDISAWAEAVHEHWQAGSQDHDDADRQQIHKWNRRYQAAYYCEL